MQLNKQGLNGNALKMSLCVLLAATYIAGHKALATDDTRFSFEIDFSLNNKASATGSNFASIGVNLAREHSPTESTCNCHGRMER